MSEIKRVKSHAFRWTITALVSVMFVVLLGGYRKHVHTDNQKLKAWMSPLSDITSQLVNNSGGNDDSMTRSSIAAQASAISGLDLTPSVTNELYKYVSTMYAAAGAWDAAREALPQTQDRSYLFNRGTIDLLQTNSFFSGDILTLYSGRQTISNSIDYLSGAVMSTSSSEKKEMSKHNLSVALATQIGVEISLCTESYAALAQSRHNIDALYSGLMSSYQRQLAVLTSGEKNQCIDAYITQLQKNISDISQKQALVSKLVSVSAAKQRVFEAQPLQCPVGIDLYQDIVTVRGYQGDLRALALQNSLLENLLLTGSMNDKQKACESSSAGSGNTQSLPDLLSELTGSMQQPRIQSGTMQFTNSGSYEALPDDTQQIIDDIYQHNIQYINTMQQTKQDNNYRPLQRIQQLFKEFYGDTTEFIK